MSSHLSKVDILLLTFKIIKIFSNSFFRKMMKFFIRGRSALLSPCLTVIHGASELMM